MTTSPALAIEADIEADIARWPVYLWTVANLKPEGDVWALNPYSTDPVAHIGAIERVGKKWRATTPRGAIVGYYRGNHHVGPKALCADRDSAASVLVSHHAGSPAALAAEVDYTPFIYLARAQARRAEEVA